VKNRTLSESLRIAEGATAEVFAWGEGYVLKLYRDGAPPHEAEQEARRARAASASGLRTPAVIEVLTVEGRQGVIYERVEGVTVLQMLLERPEQGAALAGELADLQVKMHGCSVSGLPSQRARLQQKIEEVNDLPAERKDKILRALDRLPDGDALCHGDFHPSNILLTQEGPVIIDWVDATQGHPLADVARTYMMLQTGRLPDVMPEDQRHQIELLRQQFYTAYLDRYRQLHPFSHSELDAWLPPIAAGRLSEQLTPSEREMVIRMASR